MTATEQPPKRDGASQEDKSQSSAAKWTAIGVIATALFAAVSGIAAEYFGYLKFINPTQARATPTAQPQPATADVLPPPRTFDKNHSSRLYFDPDRGHINLEVCADNLPGQTVFARLATAARTYDVLSQQASGRCVTFRDLGGDDPTLSGTIYTTRAALNQPPDDAWPAPCYDDTHGLGLCDRAQYPRDADAISIESLPSKVVYYFSGVGDPKKGNTGDGLSVVYGEDSHANYRLNYVLPDEGDGWVGLAFLFSSKQDLASFKVIEVKMTFDSDQAYCRLFIKDNTDTLEDSVPLKLGAPLPPDVAVSISGRTQTLKIPLDTNFEHVNRAAITEVDFDCDTNITRGDRTFTVNSVRFLKP